MSKKLNTTRFVKIVSPLAVAIALAGCGGDSSFGNGNSADTTSNNDTTGNKSNQNQTVDVVSIDIIPDSFNLLKNGSKAISIKAIAKNSKNNAIANANYEFTVDHGATLIVNKDSATLTPGAATKVGDELTITVKSGNKTVKLAQKIKVIEKQDQVELGEKVSTVVMRADKKELFDDGSNTIKITALPKNADNVSISAKVKFSATGPATLEVTGNTVKVTITDTAKTGDTITVNAESGGKKAKPVVIKVVKKEEQGGLKVATVDLTADSNNLLSDKSKDITFTATAKDNTNKVIGSASYEFEVKNITEENRTATLKQNKDKATLA